MLYKDIYAVESEIEPGKSRLRKKWPFSPAVVWPPVQVLAPLPVLQLEIRDAAAKPAKTMRLINFQNLRIGQTSFCQHGNGRNRQIWPLSPLKNAQLMRINFRSNRRPLYIFKGSCRDLCQKRSRRPPNGQSFLSNGSKSHLVQKIRQVVLFLPPSRSVSGDKWPSSLPNSW